MDTNLFVNLERLYEQEDNFRKDSLAMIEADAELYRRFAMVQKAMMLLYAYTIDHTSQSEEETAAQLLGVRLFNAAASSVKLGLSGYYQTAFHQLRDIMEVGFLLDYFRSFPSERTAWKLADRKTRKKSFDPVKIRTGLDDRDGDTSRRREAEYNKLSELASHATFRGFQLIVRQGACELGPFVEMTYLLAWLEEVVLRLGPSAVMYAQQFPGAAANLNEFHREFGTELIRGFSREAVEEEESEGKPDPNGDAN